MIRRLILALTAIGIGLLAASLLRTEKHRGEGPGQASRPARRRTCGATTRSGTPCSRPAEPGSDRCWQHG